MTQNSGGQFDALCEFLTARRKAILLSWRQAANADPEQTTGRSLTRGQFNDHIPEVLDAFEHQLRSRPGGAEARAAGAEQKEEEVKHGLHRWQQGYRLQELMHEWGHLQLCLFEEVSAFAKEHPEFSRESLVVANRQMITMVNEAINESTAQYERMRQAEAAGHVEDLTTALAQVNEVERRRAALIREVVHDLNGNVFGVTVAAKLLGGVGIAEPDRAEFSKLLQRGVNSVTGMLGELTELARLEAGQETRELSIFEVAALVRDLGDAHRPFAVERSLYLNLEGPTEFNVEGDPAKIRRLLQNLLLNALKYTRRGGVSISWGKETEKWWLMVKDTGPGLLAGPNAPMVVGLSEATVSARESDEKTAASKGEISHVLTPDQGASAELSPSRHQPGEGIGLSIVKRLCELLDASLEVVSSAESGTAFRVVFPLRYRIAPTR